MQITRIDADGYMESRTLAMRRADLWREGLPASPVLDPEELVVTKRTSGDSDAVRTTEDLGPVPAFRCHSQERQLTDGGSDRTDPVISTKTFQIRDTL